MRWAEQAARCLHTWDDDILNTHTHETPWSHPSGQKKVWHRAEKSSGPCPDSPHPWLQAVLLPELPAPCSCGVIPSIKARLGVAPVVPLRRGRGAAVPKLAGQSQNFKGRFFHCWLPGSWRPRGCRQGGERGCMCRGPGGG